MTVELVSKHVDSTHQVFVFEYAVYPWKDPWKDILTLASGESLFGREFG